MLENDELKLLTPGARRLVETAEQKRRQRNHSLLCVHHWLLALIECHGPMAEAMARNLNASLIRNKLNQQLSQNHAGESLDIETVVKQAYERATKRGKTQATERDLAFVILKAAGYELLEESSSNFPTDSPETPKASNEQDSIFTFLESLLKSSEESSSNLPTDTSETSKVSRYPTRVKKPTPTLEQFGRNLTREAYEEKLSPVVGREEEIRLVIETLCRSTKRNPVLVGPAGVAKTAIVEGLAQLIVQGKVPEVLWGGRSNSYSTICSHCRCI